MRKGLVRSAIGLGGILALVIAALLIAPVFVDVNQYKGKLTDVVQNQTGRNLAIDGDLSLSLFPAPTVSASGVRFSNMAGGQDPDMARMDSLKVRLSWLPLLGGTIDISRIDLVKPDILIEKLADGRTNLMFDTRGANPVGSDPNASGPDPGQPAPSEPSSGGFDVVIGGLRLIEGRVRYVDHGAGTQHSLDDINATFSMDSFDGPFDLDGSLAFMGLPLTVTAQVGSLKKTSTPLAVGIGLADQGQVLTIDAQVTDALTAPQLQGHIKVELKQASKAGADIARAFGASPIVTPLAMAAPLTIKGDLDGSLDRVRVENLSIALGPTEVKGRIAVDLGKIIKATVDLTATRIDLDDWTKSPQGGTAVPASTATTAPEKAAGPREGFLLPTDVDATLTLTVGSVFYKGQAIKDVTLAAALDPTGQLTISNVSALLPGSSSLALRGSVANAPGGAQVGVGMRAASDDLRAFLNWLDVDVGTVPPGLLRTASLTTQASGSLSQIRLMNTELQLDGTRGTGSGTLSLGGRPKVGLSLALNALDVDAYRPPATTGATGSSPPANPATGSGKASAGSSPLLASLGALNGFDAAFDVRVTALTAMKAKFENVVLKGTLTQGLLTLEAPTGYTKGIGGTALTLSGGLKGFGADPVFENTIVTVRAPSAQALLDLAGSKSGTPAVQDLPGGPVSVGVNLKGTLSALGVGASASIAGLEVRASGTLANVGSSVPSDLAFTLDVAHPDFVRMVRLVSRDYTPAQAVGAFKLTSGVKVTLNAAGSPSRLVLSDLKATIGRNTLGAALDVNLAGQKPKLTGNVALGTFNIDGLLPGGGAKSTKAPPATGGAGGSAKPSGRWSTAPLDLSALSSAEADLGLTAQSLTVSGLTVTALDTRLTLKDGTLSIPQLNGSLYGGPLGGNLTVSSQPVNAVRLSLSATNVSVQQYLAATGEGQSRVMGTASLKTDLSTQGPSVAALVGALSGSGSVTLNKIDISAFSGTGDGKIAGGLLKLLSALNKVGTLGGLGGANAVDVAAPFQVAQGVVTLTPPLSLSSPLYNGSMSGTVSLPPWTINTQGEATLSQTMLGGILKKGLKLPDRIPFGLTGSLDAPKVSVELGSLGSGTVGNIVEEGVGKLIDKKFPGGGDSDAGRIGDAAKGLLKGLR